MEPFAFSDLRSDWYAANQALPRAVRQTVERKRHFVFSGFPRQWIPVFEWFGVPWRATKAPPEHVPFFSDLSEKQLVSIVSKARRKGTLRILVESASMYDPVVSDFLYVLDNTTTLESHAVEADMREVLGDGRRGRRRTLLLNGWQSYGRPSVRAVEQRAMEVEPKSRTAVALPCAIARPYDRSRTHKRIYRLLAEQGHTVHKLHRVVITSLGVIPEELWSTPQVLAYDAGVPDIYRTLRLVRAFFGKADYACVVDCLQFGPYSDVLRIAHREGIIRDLQRVKVPGRRRFHLRP